MKETSKIRKPIEGTSVKHSNKAAASNSSNEIKNLCNNIESFVKKHKIMKGTNSDLQQKLNNEDDNASLYSHKSAGTFNSSRTSFHDLFEDIETVITEASTTTATITKVLTPPRSFTPPRSPKSQPERDPAPKSYDPMNIRYPRSECDYETNPTDLFRAIESQRFYHAQSLFPHPGMEQANVWVVRKEKNGKIRWRTTPLHTAMISCAPLKLVQSLMLASPGSLQCKDDRGQLPLHLAMKNNTDQDIICEIIHGYPRALIVKDIKGRIPFQCVSINSENANFAKICTTIMDVSKNSSGDTKNETNSQSDKIITYLLKENEKLKYENRRTQKACKSLLSKYKDAIQKEKDSTSILELLIKEKEEQDSIIAKLNEALRFADKNSSDGEKKEEQYLETLTKVIDENKKLKEERDVLTISGKTYQEREKDLRNDNKSLVKEKEEQEKTILTLNESLEMANQTANDNEEKANSYFNTLKQVKEENKKIIKRAEKLVESYEIYQKKENEYKSDLELLRKEKNEQKGIILKLNENLEVAGETASKFEDDIKEHLDTLTKVTDENNKMKKEIDALKMLENNFQLKEKELQGNLESSNKEKGKHENEIKNLNECLKIANQTANDNEAKAKDYLMTVIAVTEKNKYMKDEINTLKLSENNFQLKEKELQGNLESSSKEKDKHENEIKNLNECLKIANQDASNNEAKAKDYLATVTKVTEEKEKLTEKIEILDKIEKHCQSIMLNHQLTIGDNETLKSDNECEKILLNIDKEMEKLKQVNIMNEGKIKNLEEANKIIPELEKQINELLTLQEKNDGYYRTAVMLRVAMQESEKERFKVLERVTRLKVLEVCLKKELKTTKEHFKNDVIPNLERTIEDLSGKLTMKENEYDCAIEKISILEEKIGKISFMND